MVYVMGLMLGAILVLLGRYWLMEVKWRNCVTEYLEFP